MSSTERLKSSVFFHSRPRGGKRAGTISRIPEVDDMAECVLACCTLEQCDVILFVNGTCYTIKCNVSYPFGCTPDEDPRLSSTMVVVREPGKSYPGPVTICLGCMVKCGTINCGAFISPTLSLNQQGGINHVKAARVVVTSREKTACMRRGLKILDCISYQYLNGTRL